MKEQILKTLAPGHPWGELLQYYPCLDSTNTFAKTLAAQGAYHGTVVLAREQTGGKGRLGRSFSSPKDLGIYCSVLLRYDVPPEQLLCLTPVAAEAVRRALASVTGREIGIKWTNDLVFEKRKLCGILTELSVRPGTGQTDFVILGIGINCGQRPEDFPPEVASMATSLRQILGQAPEREAVTAALLRELQPAMESLPEGAKPWMDGYRNHCITVGQDVKIVRGDRVQPAHVDGMTDTGALLVTWEDGTTGTVLSGEVSVRGMYGYL
jgi:BirA family biotin operon repressor/biotin-[acetyl-CoA-carboxylase] ligase